jgi:hypothetical protein
MTLSIFSLLVGLLMGQRLKAFALVPAIALVLVAAVWIGIARADGIWWTTLMAIAAGTGLEIGYLVGLAIRPTPLVGRADRTASPSGSAPARRGAH